jgi:hypothetical protein
MQIDGAIFAWHVRRNRRCYTVWKGGEDKRNKGVHLERKGECKEEPKDPHFMFIMPSWHKF